MNRLTIVTMGLVAMFAVGCGPTSTAGDATASPTPAPGPHIKVTLADFMITPMQITAAPGPTNLDISNTGPTPHNFTVLDESGKFVAASRLLNTGDTQMLTVTLTNPTYKFLCSQPGHASLGMTGTITTSGVAK